MEGGMGLGILNGRHMGRYGVWHWVQHEWHHAGMTKAQSMPRVHGLLAHPEGLLDADLFQLCVHCPLIAFTSCPRGVTTSPGMRQQG